MGKREPTKRKPCRDESYTCPDSLGELAQGAGRTSERHDEPLSAAWAEGRLLAPPALGHRAGEDIMVDEDYPPQPGTKARPDK